MARKLAQVAVWADIHFILNRKISKKKKEQSSWYKKKYVKIFLQEDDMKNSDLPTRKVQLIQQS